MLSLSQAIGQEVRGRNGQPLGRVADLITRLDDRAGPNLVERVRVRCNRGADLLCRGRQYRASSPSVDRGCRFAGGLRHRGRLNVNTPAATPKNIVIRVDRSPRSRPATRGPALVQIRMIILASGETVT